MKRLHVLLWIATFLAAGFFLRALFVAGSVLTS
jgi:hypothetical protein